MSVEFKTNIEAKAPQTPLQAAANPKATLNAFQLSDLAQFTREGSFPQGDSEDFRVFYVGRDDVHGVLKYLLARTCRSLRFNQFGYDDPELNAIIVHLITTEHVYVQAWDPLESTCRHASLSIL